MNDKDGGKEFFTEDGNIGIEGGGASEYAKRIDLLAARIRKEQEEKAEEIASITQEEIEALLFENENFRSDEIDHEKLSNYREIVSKIETLYRYHDSIKARGFDVLGGDKPNAHAWLEMSSIGSYSGAALECLTELFSLSDIIYTTIKPEMEMRITFCVRDVYK